MTKNRGTEVPFNFFFCDEFCDGRRCFPHGRISWHTAECESIHAGIGLRGPAGLRSAADLTDVDHGSYWSKMENAARAE